MFRDASSHPSVPTFPHFVIQHSDIPTFQHFEVSTLPLHARFLDRPAFRTLPNLHSILPSRGEQRNRPPRGGKIRPELRKERKELPVASRFYQLASCQAAIGIHLVRIGKTNSDRFWWCHSGESQTRYHLFFRYQRWAPESRKLWKNVGEACGWKHPRAPSVRQLFQEEKAVPDLLRETKVGKMATLASLTEEDEEDLEEVELRPRGGGAGTLREKGRTRPVLECIFLLSFLCHFPVLFLCLFLCLHLFWRILGGQEIREPRCDSWILRLRGWIPDRVREWVKNL